MSTDKQEERCDCCDETFIEGQPKIYAEGVVWHRDVDDCGQSRDLACGSLDMREGK